MKRILDQFERPEGRPYATSMDDVFAIRLAKSLGDAERLSLFLTLVPQYPHAVLADAARRMQEAGHRGQDSYESLVHELTRGSFLSSRPTPEIIACKIAWRTVSLVFFRGGQFLNAETRAVASNMESAQRSTRAFVSSTCEAHPQASFALMLPDRTDAQPAKLTAVAISAARQYGIPVWTFSTSEIREAFAIPTECGPTEFRAVVSAVWPHVQLHELKPSEIDAAATAALTYVRILLHTEDKQDHA